MSRYSELGVSIKKPGIDAFKEVITNIYPNAFCVIQKDPEDPDIGIVCHTDSAGSKPIQAYLNYKESGDPKWFVGIAQDALAMNVNDIICVGAYPITFVDYVAFNTYLIDRFDLLNALAEGFRHSLKILRKEKIPILFAGGETAELPDLIKTLDVSVTIFGREKINSFITSDKIVPGDIIIGLRSGGKVRYENKENSGIQSNGLTLARTCLMDPNYVNKYPEISHSKKSRYTGKYKYDDFFEELNTTIGEALLSPTRFYAPIAATVIKKIGSNLHGMVHNTGGGQTKCLRIGKRIKFIKDNLPDPDPIFNIIQQESGVKWKEMYEDFNMGIGFEFIVSPEAVENVLKICEDYKIGVHILGKCEKTNKQNTLIIKSENGKFQYN
jgi:phosphoribosylformylglycinamidine cyclo-ligase